jgi:hypothetical protein
MEKMAELWGNKQFSPLKHIMGGTQNKAIMDGINLVTVVWNLTPIHQKDCKKLIDSGGGRSWFPLLMIPFETIVHVSIREINFLQSFWWIGVGGMERRRRLNSAATRKQHAQSVRDT